MQSEPLVLELEFVRKNSSGDPYEFQFTPQRACAGAALPFESEHDVLSHVSCARLVRTLEQAKRSCAPIAALHLLCHGAAIGGSFGLAFDDDTAPGRTAVVDAARLRMLLAPYAGMVRLVVISACDSGNSGALGNHLGSIAQELHRTRIAQVVASRFPLSVAGSIRLTEAFYEQLLGGACALRALVRGTYIRDHVFCDQRGQCLADHGGRGLDGPRMAPRRIRRVSRPVRARRDSRPGRLRSGIRASDDRRAGRRDPDLAALGTTHCPAPQAQGRSHGGRFP